MAAILICDILCYRAAFASWLMMNLLLVVVPRYGAYAMTTTGSLMLLSDFLYWSVKFFKDF